MSELRPFGRDDRAVTGVEFALVLPLAILLLMGIVDVGRYAWAFNQAEKATQIGARWAAATDIIPGGASATGLAKYSFAESGGIAQGTVVNSTAFPGVYCQSTGGTLSCTCKGTCAFSIAIDTTAQASFDALVARMAQIYPGLTADNVRIDYDWSGLGFAGDPNGADVAPIITVSLRNVQFTPIVSQIFGGTVSLPSVPYSLTMEDGSGTDSN